MDESVRHTRINRAEPDDESDPDPGDIDGDLAEEQVLPDIEDVPDESDDKMGMTFP